MPDDQNKTSISAVAPQPLETAVSSQPMDSAPSDSAPVAPEAPREAPTPVSLNDSSQNTALIGEAIPTVNEPEIPASEAEIEPVSALVSSTPASAQSYGEAKPAPTAQSVGIEPLSAVIPVVVQTAKNPIREFLSQALSAIQFRKRKKLERIMSMFLKQTKITNDEVEKFLHVSDATAERYLNILEKENKIKQTGKTGKWVSYTKI